MYDTLPGVTNENIIVMAHMDSLFDGALDNASGLAVMHALAEHHAAVSRSAPSIQLIESPQYKHTGADVMSLVPTSGLEAVARAYATIIDEVNKLDRKDLLAPTTAAAR